MNQTTTTLLSGGPIEHLESGWALMPFVGSCAHHWTEDKKTMLPQVRDGGRVRYYTSRCGLLAVTDKKAPALAPGCWPKCRRCEKGEPRFYSRKKGPPHTGAIGGQAPALRTDRITRSVIFAASCHGYAVNETQKPEAIVLPLLQYSVPKGGLVLDCFAGSGTTGVVARKTGRRAILVEKRESQCQAIVERLSQHELSLDA